MVSDSLLRFRCLLCAWGGAAASAPVFGTRALFRVLGWLFLPPGRDPFGISRISLNIPEWFVGLLDVLTFFTECRLLFGIAGSILLTLRSLLTIVPAVLIRLMLGALMLLRLEAALLLGSLVQGGGEFLERADEMDAEVPFRFVRFLDRLGHTFDGPG